MSRDTRNPKPPTYGTFICTTIALVFGVSSAYFGGQLSTHLHNQKCTTKGWGWQQLCHMTTTPAAMWQGSTTGLWTGIIFGAFLGGIVCRRR